MMIALAIFGYFVMGLAAARGMYILNIGDDDEVNSVLVVSSVVLWPVYLALAVVFFTVWGIHALATFPTKAERQAIKRKAAAEEERRIRREAVKYGLPLVAPGDNEDETIGEFLARHRRGGVK